MWGTSTECGEQGKGFGVQGMGRRARSTRYTECGARWGAGYTVCTGPRAGQALQLSALQLSALQWTHTGPRAGQALPLHCNLNIMWSTIMSVAIISGGSVRVRYIICVSCAEC